MSFTFGFHCGVNFYGTRAALACLQWVDTHIYGTTKSNNHKVYIKL
jgi:hypothetical protein